MKASLSSIVVLAMLVATPVLASPMGGQAGGVDGTGRGSRADMNSRNDGYCGSCRGMEEVNRSVTTTSGKWGVEGGFSPMPNAKGSFESGTKSETRNYSRRERGVDSFGKGCDCDGRNRSRDGGGGATGRW